MATTVCGGGERRQLVLAGEREPAPGEGGLPRQTRGERAGRPASGRGEAGDRAGGERVVDARNPAQLTGREDTVPARALRWVYHDTFGGRLTAEEVRKIQVGNQAEAAGQDVAFPLPASPRAGQDHPLDALAAERLADPRARAVRDAPERRRVTESLGDSTGLAPQASAEGGEPAQGCLLGDPHDSRSRLLQCGRHRKEERSGAGHDDAQTLEAGPGLQQGLCSAHADDARQGPAGEGEKQLARARCEHEALEGDANGKAFALDSSLSAPCASTTGTASTVAPEPP
jgi:hypothetical protein